ncbi:MAG: glycosyltransferase [Actinobacteria bacterium]|nr:glycosyltransferase [Actinomycetota bacterium]
MRILHVLEALEGGTALHVQTLADGQLAAGHAVGVAVPVVRAWGGTDDVAPGLEDAGAAVFRIAMHRTAPHPRNAGAALRLGRLVRRWHPDVIHSHSTAAGVIARVVATPFRVPIVHTPNGVHFSDFEPTREARLAQAVERAMAPLTRVVIAASASEADVLARVYPMSKVRVIPNAIAVGPAPPTLPERFRAVAVNRFVYQKSPEQVVRVMAALRARVPDAEAVLVGYGALEPQVRALVAALDPGIVVERGDGAAAIARASALVLASRWEGAPYVLLEAMNLGRPTVASDVVGSRDTVVHGETGFLFPWNDPGAGGQRLAELATDSERVRHMGAAARRRLERHYAIEGMVNAVVDVYERAVSSR